MKNQKALGTLISYTTIVFNTVVSIVLVPLLIVSLSDTEYSIYKVMQSFSGPLIMLNMGVSTIVARCIAQSHTSSKDTIEQKENTLALAIRIAVAMFSAVLLLGVALSFLIPVVYGKTYSAEELKLAKTLFLIFVAITAVHILSDYFKGYALGSEKFIVYYGATLIHHLVRFLALVILLKSGFRAVAVALCDLVLGVLLCLGYALYGTLGLKERWKFHFFDRREFKGIVSFSLAILLQAVINQVNNNMDLVILGAVSINKAHITMYSVALTVYGAYNSLLSVFSSVYFPKATQLVANGSSGEELTSFVIKPGRIQAILAVAILGGFSLFGKDFVGIWVGPAYEDAYYIILILLVPVTIPLVQNVCLAILDAKLKRLFRSVVLAGMAVLNLVVSLLLVRVLGFWGCAIGTMVSLVVGHCITINIYYQKRLELNIFRMFKEIFSGILPAGILAAVCSCPVLLLNGTKMMVFILECLVFLCFYGLFLWVFGLNSEEKESIFKVLKRKK